MDIQVNDSLSMELLRADHAEELFALTDTNRQYLREFLPWLDLTRSLADTKAFIQSTIDQYPPGQGPQFALKYQGALCGLNGFDKINLFHKTGALGYWLGSAFAGKGIITESSKALLKLGYEEYGLNKIEIHCSEENKKSCAIAERLGFVYEATLRDCEWLYTRYVSNAIYSMLAAEYFLVHKKTF